MVVADKPCGGILACSVLVDYYAVYGSTVLVVYSELKLGSNVYYFVILCIAKGAQGYHEDGQSNYFFHCVFVCTYSYSYWAYLILMILYLMSILIEKIKKYRCYVLPPPHTGCVTPPHHHPHHHHPPPHHALVPVSMLSSHRLPLIHPKNLLS